MTAKKLETTAPQSPVEIREMDGSNPHVVRQTLVGSHVVSTISLDNPLVQMMDTTLGLLGVPDGRADLTAPGSYETMVFRADPRSGEISDWTERDFRRYDTLTEANEGHEAVVAIWKEVALTHGGPTASESTR